MYCDKTPGSFDLDRSQGDKARDAGAKGGKEKVEKAKAPTMATANAKATANGNAMQRFPPRPL